ncbi:hypothetical protein AQPW35_06160 [Rubrivivax pictus]|uniref:Uncharacterized protein n=1 Tax=Pseudaquabacterium pictum TaxID=2315236 RepID=A0A480APE6_9BURK|nr:hypothetical protein AQPW35_06160 [Rubrivivax pictus]
MRVRTARMGSGAGSGLLQAVSNNTETRGSRTRRMGTDRWMERGRAVDGRLSAARLMTDWSVI